VPFYVSHAAQGIDGQELSRSLGGSVKSDFEHPWIIFLADMSTGNSIAAARMRQRFGADTPSGDLLGERFSFHAGHSEKFQDAGTYSSGNKPTALVLAVNVEVDNNTDPRRIHVGNAGEIEDGQGRGLTFAQMRLQIKDVE